MKNFKTKKITKLFVIIMALAIVSTASVGCGKTTSSIDSTASTDSTVSSSTDTAANTSADTSTSAGKYYAADATAESIVKDAASKGKVGNWGLGNEYEIQALLAKYGQPTEFLSQAFDMDGFDNDTIALASAMTYNELGLVKNSYAGGYKYGDKANFIDMNKEGVAMLEDNIFCTDAFAKANPNTVKAFIYASMKGWEYACSNPEEAAKIVYEYGSSVSSEHQAYMASEVKKLVETDTTGATVKDYGNIDDKAMQQTLDLAKKYIKLKDSAAASKLEALTLDNIRNSSYLKDAMTSDGKFGEIEKKSVSIQLKWLPQAQFMGYYVALKNGYYKDAGLDVKIVPGGGDIGETTAVYSGQVDFGVTWVSNLIAANAGGMNLIEISQVFQKSGLVLVYKLN